MGFADGRSGRQLLGCFDVRLQRYGFYNVRRGRGGWYDKAVKSGSCPSLEVEQDVCGIERWTFLMRCLRSIYILISI